MNVDLRMRCEEGEYDAAVTPDRLVFFQKRLWTDWDVVSKETRCKLCYSQSGGGGGSNSVASVAAEELTEC